MAAILQRYIVYTMLPLTGPTNAALRRHAAQECLALARLLAEEPVHAAVNRQLAALQGGQQPLLTAAQLRHACAYAAFKAAAEPFVMDTAMATARMGGIQPPLAVREFLAGASPLPRAQRAALLAAVQEAAKVAMQLEPHNLKSIMVAAAATSLLGKHQASWELFQRGFQLAQSSGSDCWMARFGVEMVQAATVLARATPRASRSSAEAAAAALPVAEAALRRCCCCT